jgi:uncharacterized glyoxalase superfamily protein PhnB
VAFIAMRGQMLSLFPREELAKDAQVSATGSGFTLSHWRTTCVPEKKSMRCCNARKAMAPRSPNQAQETFWGGYAGYFADLDGFLWEIAWNPSMDLT